MYSFIVLPALALYLYLAWKAMGAAYRSTTHPVLKFAYPAVALAVLAVLPFADIIYPRWKLAQLCATEAKTELLSTTVLPPQYFGSDGSLLHRNADPLNLDWGRLKPVLGIETSEVNVGFMGVRRTSFSVVDQRTGVALVRRTSFLYRGGWLGFTNTGFGEAQCEPTSRFESALVAAVKRGG